MPQYDHEGTIQVGDRVLDRPGRIHTANVTRDANDKQVSDATAQPVHWEDLKASERATGGTSEAPVSALDGVALGLPALLRALKLQKRAARVGFDWASPEPVLEKFAEEALEMREAMAGGNVEEMEDELGDLLFVITNLARQLKIDPARALRRANAKFELRFRAIEEAAGSRDALEAMSLDEMESLWQQVKLRRRSEGKE